MKIEVIDYGGLVPTRAHYNDAGGDVYASETVAIRPGQTEKIRTGIGIKIPDGYTALLLPRSGLSSKGIIGAVGTIDSGYSGMICATLSNASGAKYIIKKNDRIGQLVIIPIAICEFVTEEAMKEFGRRGGKGFGSTGV